VTHHPALAGGVWQDRPFVLLWSGNTASQLGARVGTIAIPLLAVSTLGASAFDMGLLAAAQSLGVILVGLPAGAWVDRLRRRRLMVRTSLLRAAVLFAVAALASLGGLNLTALALAALFLGVAGALFDLGQQTYLPVLVGRDRLVRANAALQAGQSVALSAGPALGGALVSLTGAATTMAGTGVPFLVSAVLLRRIRGGDPAPPRADRALLADIGEGLRYLWGNAALRAIACCTATTNLFMSMIIALMVLFLVRDVGLAPGIVGLIGAAAGIGGVSAALTARRWTERFGPHRTIWLSLLSTQPLGLLLPLAHRDARLVLFALGWFAVVYGATLYNIVQLSYRQSTTPDRLLGRVQATNRFLSWSSVPVGNLLGGALGALFGPRAALVIAAVGLMSSTLWLLTPPLLRPGSDA
jgi:predicted MFS family arabinose efflux permease